MSQHDERSTWDRDAGQAAVGMVAAAQRESAALQPADRARRTHTIAIKLSADELLALAAEAEANFRKPADQIRWWIETYANKAQHRR